MQTFHDNAVAHEKGIMTKANLSWAGASGCRGYLSKNAPQKAIEAFNEFEKDDWITSFDEAEA